MKRKNMIQPRFYLVVLLVVFFGSNANAFLVTNNLHFYDVQFLPTDPNATMSIEWTRFSATMYATTYSIDSDGFYHTDMKELGIKERANRAIVSQNNFSRVGIEIDEEKLSYSYELSGSPIGPQGGYGETYISGEYTVQGEGWVIISAVHSVEYEKNASFEPKYSSRAEMTFRRGSDFDTGAADRSMLNDKKSELTDTIGAGLFFNDGDTGTVYLDLYSEFGPSVPIPGTIWLLGCGIGSLAIYRKGRRKSSSAQ